MAAKESYRDRQESELEVLKSIFNEDVTDLRPQQEKWQPLNIKIALTPQKGSTVSQAYCGIDLIVICPKNYPKVTPKLVLENAKGLTNEAVVKLTNLLNKEAYSLKGEVMIFELSQFVQSFLHEHNKPRAEKRVSESFYEAMMKNKQIEDKRKQEELNEKERKIQEQLKNDILKRKEQLLKENRIRRTTGSESSPRHLSSNSEDARAFDLCEEHRRSETIYIPASGRKIQQGACLGHSQKGCINYAGIDLSSGQLVYITEWSLRVVDVDGTVAAIEKKVSDLTKLRHRNIVGYEGVVCVRKKENLHVLLVQEFLQGISVTSGSIFSCLEGASMVAKGVLDALIFLHNNGVSHGNLLIESVFMDNQGNIKVTDFSFVPYLQELINGQQSTADLPALGTLIESIMPTPHVEMRDFINRCRSDRTLSGSDLIDHPFLYSMTSNPQSLSPEEKALPRPQVLQPSVNLPVPYVDHSRLQSEFEMLNYIGKGAFGDVLKVRNILDNREYAIKRIPLSSRNKQLYKKMTREVELLSRLNHENVVRYFNSWIETQTVTTTENDEDDDSGEWSKPGAMVKTHSRRNLVPEDDSSSDDSFSPGWNHFIGNNNGNDDDSESIEFQDSQGNIVKYDDEESLEDPAAEKVVRTNVILYIQMEFCEKSTLRTAIDGNLYQDKERLWKLFREIVEGLSHIHQQGMIHRDLKPVNIFLDKNDHVKIGDFGLATTSALALQHQQVDANTSALNFGDSQTGQVGTALYVAPELSGKASKSTYNQKVDLYSLGIIFFEMCSPPLTTGMERIKTIAALRQPEVKLPTEMEKNEKLKNEVELLKWLLDHNPNKRPTSEELLQSDLVPPAKLEAYELQEMLRHVLANPQSRSYKHLIARCLAQESDTVCQLTYHTGMVPISSLFENVKNKVVQILRKHGAIDVSTPLLTPYTKSTSSETVVKLMCHSGAVVTLPHDLRQPFLRHVALNGINFLRRYSIGRIYREKRVYNFHPRQNFEVAYDIVTPTRGHFLVDAELLAVSAEIIREFEVLQFLNLSFRINHTSLLRAIFLYYSVPKDKYRTLLALVSDYLEGKLSKLNVKESVRSLVAGKDQMVDLLLMSDGPISSVNGSQLKVLIKGRGEASALAKGAIRELESVVNLSQALGVTIPINLCIGLSAGYDCSRSGSVIWQIIGEIKPGKLTVLACGGRYDNALEDYQKTAQRAGMQILNREMYCAGFSLAIDKLVSILSQLNDLSNYRAVVDLVVYVAGARPPLKEVTQILKSLWSAGIKCCFIEAPSLKDDEDTYAKELGAKHIIVLGEDGCLRVKSWQQDRYFEKNVTRLEVVEYLKRNLNADVTAVVENLHQHLAITRNNSITSMSSKSFESSAGGLSTLDIIFVCYEKPNLNKRKRVENQIEQKLGNVMLKFNKKETFAVFAVELDMKQIKMLVGCIDPNPNNQSQAEFDAILEKFPKYKQKYLQEIYDEITERLAEKKNSSIVGIYSVQDSYYRLIL